jgi:hypothetical protein
MTNLKQAEASAGPSAMKYFALLPLLLSACSLSRPEPIPPAPVDPEHCGTFEGVFDYLEVDPRPARQGATLRIAAMQRRGYGWHDVPLDCTSGWAVSDPSLATLGEDRKSVRIAPDAPPGATVTISYRIKSETVTASFVVVARDAFVITGRRGQRSAEGCDGYVSIGELEFTAGGGFSVTFQPFESYKDYWGGYLLHQETGALTLTVTGGNLRLPGLDLEGKARIADDGALVLEDMYLGQPDGRPPPEGGTCRYTFG